MRRGDDFTRVNESQTHNSRTRRDVPYRRRAGNGAYGLKQKRQQTVRIKDMRQELHMLLRTQGLDGVYITASGQGAVSCCCACYVQRPDG